MIYLLAPFKFLYKVYFGLIFCVFGILFYPVFIFLLRTEKGIPAAWRLKKIWTKCIQLFTLMGLSIKNKHNFPSQTPYIICANHASYLDIILMYSIIPKCFIFMGKSELLQWPLVHVFFRNMDVPVYRNDKYKAAKSLQIAGERLKSGYNVVIFPEGKMPPNAPKMDKFKNGAFKLAIEHQVPIVPITFLNNWLLFSDHEDVFRYGQPGIAKLIVHEPIETKGLTEEDLINLRDQTREIIKKPLYEQGYYRRNR
jgi:1-acyl-sn-glycerol-3-phosphate acyltransferase